MTLAEAKAEIFVYVGKRNDATGPVMTAAVNRAVEELAISFYFDELEETDESVETVADTETVTKPASIYVVTSVKDLTNDRDLTYKEKRWLDQQEEPVDGQPAYWIMEDEDTIRLYPTPDDEYELRIRGVKLPDLLVDTTDDASSLPFPRDWHLGVCLMASSILLFKWNIYDKAMMLKNESLSTISNKQEKRTVRRSNLQGQMKPIRKGFS